MPRKSTRKTNTKRAITPEDILQLTYVSDVQASPDGTQLVFVHKHTDEKNTDQRALWIAASDGKGDPRPLTHGGKDSLPRWSPDGETIAFVSKRGDDPQIHMLPVGGGEARALTNFPEGDIASYAWSPRGDCFAVLFRERGGDRTRDAAAERKEKGLSDPALVIDDWFYRFDGDGYFGDDRYKLYIVDVETGAHRLLYGKDRVGMSLVYSFSPDGKQLVVVTNTHRKAASQPEHCHLARINVKTGKVTRIPNVPDSQKTTVAWSPDGKTIAFVGYPEPKPGWGVDNAELLLTDPVKGGVRSLTGSTDECLEGHTISDSAEVDFSPCLYWTADSKSIVTNIAREGAQHVVSISASTGRMRALTKGRRVFSLCSVSANGKVAGVTIDEPTRPPEVAAVTLSSAPKMKRVSFFNGKLLAEVDLAAAQSYRVPSTDGVRVQTWVMHPPACAPRAPRKGRPCVLEVHGGPHCQYGETFFHEFQVLAAQGYTVVFSNPRGSKGYGEAHCTAIEGNWGNKDWDDIQAVLGFMQELDGVDTSRLAIMGGSYGGYMTNWAIGHTRAFKAAITDRCVSNMVSMFGNSDIIETPDAYWRGNTWDRTEELWAQSPQRYLGACKTPTLVIHSEGDLRCNIEQGEQVFSVLKHRGVPTRFVRYPRSTSHGMSRSGPADLRIHRLHQILAWWARWL